MHINDFLKSSWHCRDPILWESRTSRTCPLIKYINFSPICIVDDHTWGGDLIINDIFNSFYDIAWLERLTMFTFFLLHQCPSKFLQWFWAVRINHAFSCSWSAKVLLLCMSLINTVCTASSVSDTFFNTQYLHDDDRFLRCRYSSYSPHYSPLSPLHI